MALEYKAGKCARCGPMKLERKGTNHILHFLITVCTIGVWLIVWLGLTVKFGGWRCSTCGSKNVSTRGVY